MRSETSSDESDADSFTTAKSGSDQSFEAFSDVDDSKDQSNSAAGTTNQQTDESHDRHTASSRDTESYISSGVRGSGPRKNVTKSTEMFHPDEEQELVQQHWTNPSWNSGHSIKSLALTDRNGYVDSAKEWKDAGTSLAALPRRPAGVYKFDTSNTSSTEDSNSSRARLVISRIQATSSSDPERSTATNAEFNVEDSDYTRDTQITGPDFTSTGKRKFEIFPEMTVTPSGEDEMSSTAGSDPSDPWSRAKRRRFETTADKASSEAAPSKSSANSYQKGSTGSKRNFQSLDGYIRSESATTSDGGYNNHHISPEAKYLASQPETSGDTQMNEDISQDPIATTADSHTTPEMDVEYEQFGKRGGGTYNLPGNSVVGNRSRFERPDWLDPTSLEYSAGPTSKSGSFGGRSSYMDSIYAAGGILKRGYDGTTGVLSSMLSYLPTREKLGQWRDATRNETSRATSYMQSKVSEKEETTSLDDRTDNTWDKTSAYMSGMMETAAEKVSSVGSAMSNHLNDIGTLLSLEPSQRRRLGAAMMKSNMESGARSFRSYTRPRSVLGSIALKGHGAITLARRTFRLY